LPLHLKDNWAILVEPDNFFLTNTEYGKKNWFTLDWRHSYVLAALDGSHDPGSIARDFASYAGTSDEYAVRLVELTIQRYHQCITESNKRSDNKPRIYRLKEPLPLTDLQRARNSAPGSFKYVSTIMCNKHCKYCYMDARRIPPDASVSLPVESIRRIADEAARLAVSEILITGGEPFLSHDMYDIVNSFVDNGLYVRVTTKSRVDGSKFSPAARDHLTVECSLDSTDEAFVSFITGSKSSLSEALDTMRSLSRSHIRFIIKMVTGRANHKDIPAMARLCREMGGAMLQVGEYRSGIGRFANDHLLGDEHRSRMLGDIDRARSDEGITIEHMIGPLIDDKYYDSPGSYCSEGIYNLSFLSDGTCTKCPALPADMNLTGGNVFKEGIYGTWNDSADYMSVALPDDSRYAGTICQGCEKMGECGLTGRCLLRSKLWHSLYYGPDRVCKYVSTMIPGVAWKKLV
jgi:MoaA/NifB/PqqE/SkfB family radical SAM enzyme